MTDYRNSPIEDLIADRDAAALVADLPGRFAFAAMAHDALNAIISIRTDPRSRIVSEPAPRTVHGGETGE